MLGALKVAPALCAGNVDGDEGGRGRADGRADDGRHLPGVPAGRRAERADRLRSRSRRPRSPTIRRSRKLSFTGSTEVGKIIMRAAAERIVPVSLELGGKSPSIVYPDADEDWAVDGIINAMRFTRQSQSCTAGSRLFLHEDIFDSFLKKLEKKTTALKIGDPLDEASDIGTIINNKQYTKVCKYVQDGLDRSDAKLVFGGLPPKTGPLTRGLLHHPDGLCRPLQRLAAGARGDLRPGAGRDPLERRGRGDPHGQRQPLRPRRLCLDARHRQAPARRARDRDRAGCRSTRAAARPRACPTAATSRAASAASSRSRACSTASRRGRA